MADGRAWSSVRVLIGLGCVLWLAAAPPLTDWIREANAAFLRHDLDTADQLYARAEERSNDPGLIAFNRASVLFERGEFLEAERHYLRSLDDRECPPDRAMRAWFNRGICLLRRGGDAKVYRSAIASFERCLDLNPSDPQFRARVEYHLELAKVLWIQANQAAAKPTRPEDLPPEERGPEAPPQPRASGQDEPMGASDPGAKQNPSTTQQPIPQPAPLPKATQTPNATPTKIAGNNTQLPVVRGGVDLDATTPESARDILKQTDHRLRQRREQMNAILGWLGPIRSARLVEEPPRMPVPRCLLRFIGMVLAVFALTNQVAAQESQFFEPKEGFYQARGIRVSAAWSVDRVTIPEDEELLATLTIRGAMNPQEIVRPDLRKLKAYAESFRSIVDVPGPMVPPDATEVAFTYRLRPRDRMVNRLPSLDFFVLNPAIKNRNPFENARVKGIDLVVTAPAPQPPPAPIPLAEPESLFKLETGSGILVPVSYHPGILAWFAIGILGPTLATGWVLIWRHLYPDAARLAHLRRGLAARRALTAIHRAARGHEPASIVATAMRDYLHARFGVPRSAETPAEVDAALQQTGVEPRAEIVELFRRIDELRFAPASDNGLSIIGGAEALIARLEAPVR